MKHVRQLINIFSKNIVEKKESSPINTSRHIDHASVDTYWNEHTVNSTPFKTAKDSIKYLDWRFKQYPLFKEFMQLWGLHDRQIMIDYGCGPGNDLVGFLTHTNAKKVIGIDISEKSLKLASQRMVLHEIDPARVELIHTSDVKTKIPIGNDTVDYIYCEGVLHHTIKPEEILKEFFRILKHNSFAHIMVYNSESIWLHLYVAYVKLILQKEFPNTDAYEAFHKTTDGEKCPIARCYAPNKFVSICNKAGFKTEFVGGYFSLCELDYLKKFGKKAIDDERLAEKHREFIKKLTYDKQGYPTYDGKHAGIGGVYKLYKE